MTDNDKIAKAAAHILAYALEKEQPFYRVSEVITMLRANTDWTEAEVIDVQTRVIQSLKTRLGKEPPAP